ncbi:glycoside hydrolase 5 family protein [Mangrovibacterium diazotrophicum]|uniref:mannan endo-1,4-beta-mannosidase n=1 Tax=Mangrovibacterium diazotrophicum TaxID=1261403 RepID=A0A419W4H4_9BACT|nr:fibronectin type III domain-containing protein [Mangrovibacterium diazotrophicum]RKD90336.1 hypothetical protein BC643_0673 [Mangrovibacterium diazotrophicum]
MIQNRQLKIYFLFLMFLFGGAKLFAFDNFITRHGDQLMDGKQVFRFIGVNAPNINGHYDGYMNTNPESGYLYDPIELSFEMESYFEDMAQMGVTVFRTWGITVEDGSGEFEALVNGAYSYNETAFRRIDKMLELCNKYQMRVILCLVKENKYWGGTEAFSKLYGGGDYYESEEVKNGFKDLLKVFAERVNSYTGVPYKDDKSIMAWEFGNEVPNHEGAWINEMAKYLKKLAPNQLISDPRRANGVDEMETIVNDVVRNCKDIDLVKTRQYPNYKNSVTELWQVCEGKRPLLIDEFQKMEGFTDILDEICETGTSGGLLWSLMKPQYNGGIGGHALFHAYSWGGSRWPGFDSGDYFNERENLMKIREYGYKIRGEVAPPLPPPAGAPYLYPSLEKDAVALKWRCASGARYYLVERSTTPEGPWTDVSGEFDISYSLYYYPMFSDSSVMAGESYYYRVIGKNETGQSEPSNIVGPIRPGKKMVMDNLADFSMITSSSENMEISTETWPRFRQTEEDFFQLQRIAGSSSGFVTYNADEIKSIQVFVYSGSTDEISLEYSNDGKTFQPIPDGALVKSHRDAYASQISGWRDNTVDKFIYSVSVLPKGTSYVKISTGRAGQSDSFPWIGRVHLGYLGKLNSKK